MIVAKLTESLNIKKSELSNRLAAIESDLKKGRSQDFAEQGSECKSDQELDEIHQQTLNEIAQINDALKLLSITEYGVCTQCGERISEQRLLALPQTNLCISCAH